MRKRGFNKGLQIKYKTDKKGLVVSEMISVLYSPAEAVLLSKMIDRFNYWLDVDDYTDFGDGKIGFFLTQRDIMKVLGCSRPTVGRHLKEFRERKWITTIRDEGNQNTYLILNIEKILGLEIELKPAYLKKMKEIDDMMPSFEDGQKAIKKHKEASIKKKQQPIKKLVTSEKETEPQVKETKSFDDYQAEQEKRDAELFSKMEVKEIDVTEEVIEKVAEETEVMGSDGRKYKLSEMLVMSPRTLKGLDLDSHIPKEHRPEKLTKVEKDMIESKLLTESVTNGFDGDSDYPF